MPRAIRPPDFSDPDRLGPLYLPVEAGRVLGVGRSTIYAMVKGGELYATYVRGYLRISELALRTYLAEHDTTPTAELAYLATTRRSKQSA